MLEHKMHSSHETTSGCVSQLLCAELLASIAVSEHSKEPNRLRKSCYRLSTTLFYAVIGNTIKPGLHISHKHRKHMFVNMYFKLSRYGLVYISL